MPDLTYTERLYSEAEMSFARWIVDMGGWCHEGTVLSGDGLTSKVATDWLFSSGRLRAAKKDGRAVVELTPAGRAWFHEHGAA